MRWRAQRAICARLRLPLIDRGVRLGRTLGFLLVDNKRPTGEGARATAPALFIADHAAADSLALERFVLYNLCGFGRTGELQSVFSVLPVQTPKNRNQTKEIATPLAWSASVFVATWGSKHRRYSYLIKRDQGTIEVVIFGEIPRFPRNKRPTDQRFICRDGDSAPPRASHRLRM
jgi:hypothetical protein